MKIKIRPNIKQSEQSKAAQARAMIYHALAEALSGPDWGIQSRLLDVAATGARLLNSAACQKVALILAKLPAIGLEDLDERYTQLITNSGRRPLALYESLHRQGCLMGQSARDVERHYRQAGLAPVDGELPDHASVELAYLGHLAASEAEAHAAGKDHLVARLKAEQRAFLRRHAAVWLPEVGTVMATAGDSFYAAVGCLLSGFLTENLNKESNGRKRHQQSGQNGVRLPILKDQAACTLCGLCTGSCSSGALRIIENETQTALMLNPEQCTGCSRCAYTCPEEILMLSFVAEINSPSGVANEAGYRIMRQSPRVGCPNCNRPTVSQAELAAVFRRLQPDPVTQQRLSLCVECKSWPM